MKTIVSSYRLDLKMIERGALREVAQDKIVTIDHGFFFF